VSEQSFTPGPWFRSGVRRKVDGMDNHSIVATVGGKEITVATVWYDPRTHEGFHDANMIAASPALLEALKEILSHANRAEITAKEWSAGLAALRLATEPTNEA
jgi:hypothetical protein